MASTCGTSSPTALLKAPALPPHARNRSPPGCSTASTSPPAIPTCGDHCVVNMTTSARRARSSGKESAQWIQPASRSTPRPSAGTRYSGGQEVIALPSTFHRSHALAGVAVFPPSSSGMSPLVNGEPKLCFMYASIEATRVATYEEVGYGELGMVGVTAGTDDTETTGVQHLMQGQQVAKKHDEFMRRQIKRMKHQTIYSTVCMGFM
eukprot:768520-Hanusia_phi.AAC.5